MKGFRGLVLAAAVLLLAVGAMATACDGDGDGELTTEEYFREVQAIADDVDERFVENEAELDEAFADLQSPVLEGENLDLFKDNFSTNVDIINDARDSLADLEPPSDVQDAHDAFHDALAAFAEEIEGFGERIDDLEGSVDLDEFFSDPENNFDDADQAFTAACLEFEETGQQYFAELNLDCED